MSEQMDSVSTLPELIAALTKDKIFNNDTFFCLLPVIREKDELSIMNIISALSKKYGLLKKNITKFIYPDTDKEDKDTDTSGTPKITVVENFIKRYYDVRFNIISNNYEYKEKKQGYDWEIMNESTLWRRLQKNHIDYPVGNVIEIMKSDFTPRFDPFTEYFESLKYDGKTDYIKQLADYIKLTDETDKVRFDIQLKKNFVRNIACALGHDFNKQIFILIGETQSQGKSTLIRWFCPPMLKDYIIENISMDKDLLRALAENFIMNLDELASMSKMELNTFKTMASKDIVKVRIQFDKKFSTLVRRANFYGSTNNREFLIDVTGSVRYVIFDVDKIDFNYSKNIDINDLWSQAYHEYKNGFYYKFTKDEEIENNTKNQKHYITTPEIDLINTYLMPGEKDNDLFYTSSDIVEYLTTETNGHIKLNHIQIGRTMKHLGFELSQKYSRENGFPQKGYWIKKNPDAYNYKSIKIPESEKTPF